jgi:hypothetical protein
MLLYHVSAGAVLRAGALGASHPSRVCVSKQYEHHTPYVAVFRLSTSQTCAVKIYYIFKYDVKIEARRLRAPCGAH